MRTAHVVSSLGLEQSASPSAPALQTVPRDAPRDGDGLRAARGIFLGMILGAVLWTMVFLGIWLAVR
jgi:hypothetical protein